MSTAATDFPDLERFDDTYQPAERTGFRPGLEVIPDGPHDFTILSAELTRTKNSNELILRAELRCEDTLQVIERPWFFTNPEAVARLGGDLVLLGFDADRWTSQFGRKFSEELPKAVGKLGGKRFRGTKKIGQQNGKPILFIDALLTSSSPPLPRSTPASGNPFTPPAAPESLPANPAAPDECPF